MMKSAKRMISILLAALLMAATLIGCGGQDTTNDTTTTDSDSETVDSETSTVNFPNGGTIKIIVPYAAGGNTDLLARAVADELAKELDTNVVVENQAGGSGAIGMSAVAISAPDGYTMVCCANGAATTTPNNSDVGYTDKEFLQVCQVAETASVFCVNKSLGVSTWDEFMEYAKANGATYGTAGAGMIANIFAEMVLKEADLRDYVTHVPFDGGATAATNCMGNQVNACIAGASEVASFVSSGDLIPLWVSTGERDKMYPDTPTASELGYSLANGSWTGFAVPAGTDPAIVEILDNGIKAVIDKPEVQEIFDNLGNSVVYLNHEEFRERWLSEYETNKIILEELKS